VIKQRDGKTTILCDACRQTRFVSRGVGRWAALAARKEAVAQGWMARHGHTWCPACSSGIRAKQAALDFGSAEQEAQR
jgi:hypothetical protein